MSDDSAIIDSDAQSLSELVDESTLMDFVELWANQRDSVCQRLNGARLLRATRRYLEIDSVWHVWEHEELSQLRGGYFQHSATTCRSVRIPYPAEIGVVQSRSDLPRAIAAMKRIVSEQLFAVLAPTKGS